MSKLPTPRIVQRPRSAAVHQAALSQGYTPLQAGILAGRLGDAQAASLSRTVRPQIADLDPPDSLPDIDRAADRLARAVVNGEDIICCSDHDCDGVSGHSIVRAAMLDVFRHDAVRMHSFISHRLQEGYGISEGVVARIAAAGHRSGVLVSVDQGSSDEPRIAKLKALGIDTIVTDHHGVEGKGPPSALACVNPAREDGKFPDKTIAGCHTAWLTMCAVRERLMACGHLPREDTPNLGYLLDYDALGVVADCVDLGVSRNNRLVVQRGLLRMNRNERPCWQAMRQVLEYADPFCTADIAFKLGPHINARGRMDEAMAGVRFLRAPTLAVAHALALQLHAANEDRKLTERRMKEGAMQQALDQVNAGSHGIAIWMPDGHSGVHGVTASRLVEAFGRPTVCLSPKLGAAGLVTGSIRTMGGFHVREALLRIQTMDPDLLIAFGGHRGAGGCTLNESDIQRFQQLWAQVVEDAALDLGPVVLTDGPLPGAPDLALLAQLGALEPYGREFDAPQFSDTIELREIREVGEGGAHLKLQVGLGGRTVDAIWFNAPAAHRAGLAPGVRRQAAFSLDQNTWRGNTKLQLLVRALAPAA